MKLSENFVCFIFTPVIEWNYNAVVWKLLLVGALHPASKIQYFFEKKKIGNNVKIV